MSAAEAEVPFTMPFNPDGIPDELKRLDQWVGWRLVQRADTFKPTKIPINVKTLRKASSTDPRTWGSFARAIAAYNLGQVDGVGFVFTREDPYIGIDRDDIAGGDSFGFDPLVDQMDTYADVSPSGKGIHIIGKGKLPVDVGKHPKGLGIFEHSRFFTMTGNLLDGKARPIRDVQHVIDQQWDAWFPKKPEAPRHASQPGTNDPSNDEDVLSIALSATNGARFRALWDGDTGAYGGDISAADLALMNLLRFYTRGNAAQMERLFSRSTLGQRDKWKDRSDYRERTITRALDSADYYTPPGKFRVMSGGRSEAPPPHDAPPLQEPYNEGEPETNEAIPRPAIDAGNQDLEIASAQAWAALQRSNIPPRLFRFGGVPVRVEGSEDGDVPVAQTLTEDRFGHELARSAVWFKITQKGDEKPAAPPPRVIKDMLAAPFYPLPALLSIVQAPVFAADGSLQTEPGYHEAGRSFYAPAPGFVVPPVPEHPTDEDVERAKSLIVDDLLGEFPFISEAELANTVALFLDPYIRNLIDGPTPLRLIEAPTPGSGKGLLADVILRAAIGRHVNIMPAANDDDEWRKRVTAQLSQIPAVILIDNLTSALDSGALASALTTTWWNDRRLGSNEMIRVPIRCVWLATANNPTMSTELARRTVRIRLDPKVDRPWQRTGFRHEDLRGWADDHRPQIVCAALTLVQAWIQAGRPMGTIRLGSFEQWAAVHGGILTTIGINGFLANLEQFYEAADVEGAIWRQFIDLWFDRFNESEVGAADLFGLAQNVEGFDFGKGSERAQKTSFGMALGRQRDRVIGDCRITQTRTVRRLKQWRLIKARPGGNPFDIFRETEAGDDSWTR